MRPTILGFGLMLGLTTSGLAQTARDLRGSTSSRGSYAREAVSPAILPYEALILEYSDQFGVDPALVIAVITIESQGDPTAYSSAGAMGLMQLMPSTCEDYGVDNPYDPEQNIRGGTDLLGHDIDRYKGDLTKALAAYNAGPSRVDDGSWKTITETKRYVPAVLKVYKSLASTWDRNGVPPSQPSPPVLPQIYRPPYDIRDAMFQAVSRTQESVEIQPVAENPCLNDAADAILSRYQKGSIDVKDIGSKAAAFVKKAGFKAASVEAVIITTADEDSFASEWAQQPQMQGRFMGFAHDVVGSKHLWVVVLATQ